MEARTNITSLVLLSAVCRGVGCGRKPERVLGADSKDFTHTVVTAHLDL